MTKLPHTEPVVPVERLIELALKPALKTRDDIEQAQYHPGWHGEHVLPGDVVVVWGHGGWRRAIATKITPSYVHAQFTTPGAIKEAQRINDGDLARDPLRVRAQVREQELRNWDYYAGEVGPNPRHPDFRQPGELARMQEHVDEGREAYADRLADKAADRVMADIRRAQTAGYVPLVNVTNGKGDRTGARTGLYIQDGTIPENAL